MKAGQAAALQISAVRLSQYGQKADNLEAFTLPPRLPINGFMFISEFARSETQISLFTCITCYSN
jgi:hypothetical protein